MHATITDLEPISRYYEMVTILTNIKATKYISCFYIFIILHFELDFKINIEKIAVFCAVFLIAVGCGVRTREAELEQVQKNYYLWQVTSEMYFWKELLLMRHLKKNWDALFPLRILLES